MAKGIELYDKCLAEIMALLKPLEGKRLAIEGECSWPDAGDRNMGMPRALAAAERTTMQPSLFGNTTTGRSARSVSRMRSSSKIPSSSPGWPPGACRWRRSNAIASAGIRGNAASRA